jgi:hypothetical protein
VADVLELRRDAGREGEPFQVHVISADAYSPAGIERLEAMGVTDVIVGFRWAYQREPDRETLATKMAALQRYADTVMTVC